MSKNVSGSVTALIVLTFFVKAIGFLKQAVISYTYGVSSLMDSYLIVVDFINELGMVFFASIAITIVALYDEVRHDKDKASVFISNTFVLLLWFSVFIILILSVFAKPIAFLLAPGFSQEQLIAIAGKIRLISFLLLNICISNICIALLNAEKEFVVAKSTGVIQSVCIILACFLLKPYFGIEALYIGFIAYYIVENLYLLAKVKHYISFKPLSAFRDSKARSLIKLSVPLFISNAVIQINVIINKAIASGLGEGSISALSYGSFVFNTIHSIVIASITTVLYSFFSQYVVEGNDDAIIEKTSNTVLLLLTIIIPITVISCINNSDIIRLIYGRGSFDENAVNLTSDAFLGYSFGIVFIALRDIYLQVLYAYKRTRIAMLNGMLGVVINLFLSFLLSKVFGVLGISVADSITYFVIAMVCFYTAKNVVTKLGSPLSRKDFVCILLCTVLSILAGKLINRFLVDEFFLVRLVISSLLVLLVYFFVMHRLKCSSLRLLTEFVKTKLRLRR